MLRQHENRESQQLPHTPTSFNKGGLKLKLSLPLQHAQEAVSNQQPPFKLSNHNRPKLRPRQQPTRKTSVNWLSSSPKRTDQNPRLHVTPFASTGPLWVGCLTRSSANRHSQKINVCEPAREIKAPNVQPILR